MNTLYINQNPSMGSDPSFKVRVIENKFGDGYRQTSPDGLNAVERSWPVSWANLTIANADILQAFFIANAGKPFRYTMPRETAPRVWDCTDFKRGYPAGGYDSFQATLRERFDLG